MREMERAKGMECEGRWLEDGEGDRHVARGLCVCARVCARNRRKIGKETKPKSGKRRETAGRAHPTENLFPTVNNQHSEISVLRADDIPRLMHPQHLSPEVRQPCCWRRLCF